jgi:hypothetical protein
MVTVSPSFRVASNGKDARLKQCSLKECFCSTVPLLRGPLKDNKAELGRPNPIFSAVSSNPLSFFF